jgi:hypothetical protein
MTPISADPPLRTPPDPDSSPGSAAAGRPAATPAVQVEHAQERWSRWLTTREQSDQAARRRFYVIAGVIVLGLLAWLFWTF